MDILGLGAYQSKTQYLEENFREGFKASVINNSINSNDRRVQC